MPFLLIINHYFTRVNISSSSENAEYEKLEDFENLGTKKLKHLYIRCFYEKTEMHFSSKKCKNLSLHLVELNAFSIFISYKFLKIFTGVTDWIVRKNKACGSTRVEKLFGIIRVIKKKFALGGQNGVSNGFSRLNWVCWI